MTEKELLSVVEMLKSAVNNEKSVIVKNILSHKEAAIVSIFQNISNMIKDYKKGPNKTLTIQSTDQISKFCRVADEIKNILINRSKVSQNELEEILKSSFLKTESLLSIISRERNENTHSDLITPLFRSDFVGLSSATHTYFSFLNTIGLALPNREIASINASREVRLASLTMREDISDKRIDILIVVQFKDGLEEYLIIENKVLSKETEDQTTSYWQAMHEKQKESKGRIFRCTGFLLSPYGTAPQSSNFYALSYTDLFKILIDSKNSMDNATAKEYCKFYLFELASTILRRQWIFQTVFQRSQL